MWWRPSPLLVLYNVIRWTQLRKDQITREDFQLQRLAELPPLLVEPMKRAAMAGDRRLVRPALVEAAYLWAGMSFVGHLAGFARFFELLCMAIQEDPAWVNVWHDNIERTLSAMEHLESTCIEVLHWVRIANPKFVEASHIHGSRIVPALCKFLNMTVVNSDPNCERWRLSVEVLLRAWAPLDLEVVNQAYEGVSMIFSEPGF
ncbi:hypothetical protein JB92DRAFT_152616 [Gautieria morchelliformis]|nr:hypothetical protein JB92DRAFT_152616 [Gautieria morchelliformis]